MVKLLTILHIIYLLKLPLTFIIPKYFRNSNKKLLRTLTKNHIKLKNIISNVKFPALFEYDVKNGDFHFKKWSCPSNDLKNCFEGQVQFW